MNKTTSCLATTKSPINDCVWYLPVDKKTDTAHDGLGGKLDQEKPVLRNCHQTLAIHPMVDGRYHMCNGHHWVCHHYDRQLKRERERDKEK